jgi:hypothetical protein
MAEFTIPRLMPSIFASESPDSYLTRSARKPICTTACLGWCATSVFRSLRSCRLSRLLTLRRSPKRARALRSGATGHAATSSPGRKAGAVVWGVPRPDAAIIPLPGGRSARHG